LPSASEHPEDRSNILLRNFRFLTEYTFVHLKGKYMKLKVQHMLETRSCRLLNEKQLLVIVTIKLFQYTT